LPANTLDCSPRKTKMTTQAHPPLVTRLLKALLLLLLPSLMIQQVLRLVQWLVRRLQRKKRPQSAPLP
jgi:hypothetical protein